MWWIIGFTVAVLIVIVIFETRGALDRTEKKLDEMHKILLELQDAKKGVNVEE